MFTAALFSLALLYTPEAPPPAAAKPATNALCPVMGKAVNEKSKVAIVKGQEYRICCAMCTGRLQKDPDKYLNADGTPKNAKK